MQYCRTKNQKYMLLGVVFMAN